MTMNLMSRTVVLGTVLFCLLSARPALAETMPWKGPRADSHAPIGVMGEHTHGTGEWMVSYRFMLMSMDGNRSGTNDLSVSDVLNSFNIAPTTMDMFMHMFGAMVAPAPNITIMAMVPYVSKSMSHLTGAMMGNQRFTTHSQGLGDISTSALVSLYKKDGLQHLATVGFSLPTGAIDNRDDTPMGNQVLPYPMQIGSGTVDGILGYTFTKLFTQWSIGSQLKSQFRIGTNSRGYALGNVYTASSWVTRQFSRSFTSSLRVLYTNVGDVRGSDSALNPAMVPTATTLRGGQRIDVAIGSNYLALGGFLKGHRIAVEVGLPLYQRFNGVTLETDWWMQLGWQKAF